MGGDIRQKDVLSEMLREFGELLPSLRAVLIDERDLYLARHIRGAMGKRVVAVLGAAFKPDTDDVRESPTLRIVPALVQAGMEVTLHDPIALDNAKAELGDDLSYTTDLDAALEGADAVVVVTSWKDYADLPSKLAVMSPQPMLADGRRSYSPDVVERYTGVGYPAKG